MTVTGKEYRKDSVHRFLREMGHAGPAAQFWLDHGLKTDSEYIHDTALAHWFDKTFPSEWPYQASAKLFGVLQTQLVGYQMDTTSVNH